LSNKRQKYMVRKGNDYIHYETRKDLAGILYLRENDISVNIATESRLKEKGGFYEGKQNLKQRIVMSNIVKDITIPLKIRVEVNNIGERPTQKIFIGYGYDLRDRVINGLKFVDEEIIDELEPEDMVFLERINIRDINTLLVSELSGKTRHWTPLLSALQQIYNRNIRLFHKVRVKLYDEVAGHTVVGANIVLEVNGFDYFLKTGSAIDCKDEEVRSFVFTLPRAEIVKKYIEEV